MTVRYDRRKTPKTTGYCIFTSLPNRAYEEAKLSSIHEITALNTGEVPCYSPGQGYPHAHDDHEIQLMESGSGLLSFGDDEEIELTAGQIAFLPSGLPHQLKDLSPGSRLHGLYLHPDVLRLNKVLPSHDTHVIGLAQTNAGVAGRCIFDLCLFHSLNEIFAQTQLEYGRHDGLYLQSLAVLGQYVGLLLIRLMGLHGYAAGDELAARRVLQVKAWLDRHFREEATLPGLAGMAQLSPAYFSNLFRHVVGLSPKAYLIQQRIHQAMNLLSYTQLPILEIALRSGFESISCFNRSFRLATDLSPTEYRKISLENQKKSADG